jgi:hypothetical protein
MFDHERRIAIHGRNPNRWASMISKVLVLGGALAVVSAMLMLGLRVTEK